MNKVILMGRLTRDPEVRYASGDNLAIARYTLAVDRRFHRDGEATADFINCVTFGHAAEFAEKLWLMNRNLQRERTPDPAAVTHSQLMNRSRRFYEYSGGNRGRNAVLMKRRKT